MGGNKITCFITLLCSTIPGTVIPYSWGSSALPDKLLSIQYLRGVAALMVVIHHTDLQLRRGGYEGWWPSPLLTSSGVDIFFVISGFIMWVTTASRHMPPSQFYARRLARIVPLYWFFTTIVVLVAIMLPSAMQSGKFDIFHAAASYLFIPYPSPADGQLVPVLVPGWTLNYEMLFYVIFGLALFIRSTSTRLLIIAITLIVMTLAGYAFRPSPTENPPLFYWTNAIVLEFLFGVLIGWGASILPAKQIIGWVCVAVGLLALAFASPDVPRFIMLGVPAALIVLGIFMIEHAVQLPKWRLAKILGDSSYSLYLSHVIFLSAFAQLWRKLALTGSPIGHWTFGILAVVTSGVIGIAIYYVIERPLIRLTSGRRSGQPQLT